MKKLFTLLMVAMMFAFSACNSCNKQVEKEQTIEDILTADYDYMVENYDTTFVWYEVQFILNDYLDSEECDGTVKEFTNIFQVVTPIDSITYDVYVVKMFHKGEISSIETEQGFWCEDEPMIKDRMQVTYNDAYQRMTESNYPKPHANTCTLRRELGPKIANSQYIFGNVTRQIYVDAVTGVVSDHSPAFDEVECEDAENLEEILEEVAE